MTFVEKIEFIEKELSIYKIEKKLRYCFHFHCDFEYKKVRLNKKEKYQFYSYLDFKYDMNEVKKINNSYYAKRSRLKKRVDDILSSELDCYFITLTFNSETLANTKVDVRRKYVQKFLKSQCANYVANVDFGKKRNREHYHAVVCTNKDLTNWPYGFKKYQLIYNYDVMALSTYVAKLSNHAIKDTTKRSYLIYARQKKEKKDIINLSRKD